MARVLVVDDEADVRSMLALALSREGYTIEEAADGRTALEKLRADDYDLVVLDVMMPGMSGRAVAREVRADPDLRRTPIVMLTALTGERNTAKGRRSGADLYLSKPVDLQALRGHVLRLIQDTQGPRSLAVSDPGRTFDRERNGAA